MHSLTKEHISWTAQPQGDVSCHQLPMQGKVRQGHYNPATTRAVYLVHTEPQQRPSRTQKLRPAQLLSGCSYYDRILPV